MSLFVYSINPETELIWRTYGTEWNVSFRIWLIELTIFTEYVPSKMPVDWDLFTDDTGRQCRTYQDTSNNHVARCFSWPCHLVSHHSAWEVFPLWRPDCDWARVLACDGPSPATHQGTRAYTASGAPGDIISRVIWGVNKNENNVCHMAKNVSIEILESFFGFNIDCGMAVHKWKNLNLTI